MRAECYRVIFPYLDVLSRASSLTLSLAELCLSSLDHKTRKNSDVCTKYQEASKIVNLALQGLITQCIPGAKIIDLCQFGTTVIDAATSKLYNKKVNGQPVEKGVAFPVCISVNDVICNHSPLASEELVSLVAAALLLSFKFGPSAVRRMNKDTRRDRCDLVPIGCKRRLFVAGSDQRW